MGLLNDIGLITNSPENYSPTVDSLNFGNQFGGSVAPSSFSNVPKQIADTGVQYGTPTQFENQSIFVAMNEILNKQQTTPESLAKMPEQDFLKAVNSYQGDKLLPLRQALYTQRDIGLNGKTIEQQYTAPVEQNKNMVQTTENTQKAEPVLNNQNNIIGDVGGGISGVISGIGDGINNAFNSAGNLMKSINTDKNPDNFINKFAGQFADAMVMSGGGGGEYNPMAGAFKLKQAQLKTTLSGSGAKTYKLTRNASRDSNGNLKEDENGPIKQTGILSVGLDADGNITQKTVWNDEAISKSEMGMADYRLLLAKDLEDYKFINRDKLQNEAQAFDAFLQKRGSELSLDNAVTKEFLTNTLGDVKKISESYNNIQSVQNMWGEYVSLSKKLADEGKVGLLSGSLNKVGGKYLDPDVARIMSLREQLTVPIKKALGDSGNVGQSEQEKILKSLGDLSASPEAFLSSVYSTGKILGVASEIVQDRYANAQYKVDALTTRGVDITDFVKTDNNKTQKQKLTVSGFDNKSQKIKLSDGTILSFKSAKEAGYKW